MRTLEASEGFGCFFTSHVAYTPLSNSILKQRHPDNMMVECRKGYTPGHNQQ